MFDELTISDKEITEYLKLKYPKTFHKTTIQFNLILLPKAQPCCRSIVISDSSRISKEETESLLKYVISFPNYSKIKIDKPRHLLLVIACDSIYKPTGIFMAGYGAK